MTNGDAFQLFLQSKVSQDKLVATLVTRLYKLAVNQSGELMRQQLVTIQMINYILSFFNVEKLFAML